MRMVDLIAKKKHGLSLSKEEIEWMVKGFTKGNIPDYQMAAFLMAVCFQKMNKEETAHLTLAMANSGELVDLSAILGKKIDKHSTGGVGDKTTLVISPIVASLGVPIAKMSGRGLGHTGGTVDKLEAIPGLKTAFSREEFVGIVNQVGVCVAGQSGNLAPADKKIYALRDVTATVDNLSLIAASIMSKKIAAGADAILLDVKTGSGAFMKTVADSVALAQEMVGIGESVGRHVVALVTDMGTPLGHAVGNSLEIIEVVETLKGKGPKDLTDICIALSANMLVLAGVGTINECYELAKNSIASGQAFQKFVEMVKAQGGDWHFIEDCSLFPKAPIVFDVLSPNSGYVSSMDTEGIGLASCLLGAGRETETSIIDNSAGIVLFSKTGDKVEKGQLLAKLHTSSEQKAKQGAQKLLESYCFSSKQPKHIPLILARVDKCGSEVYADIV